MNKNKISIMLLFVFLLLGCSDKLTKDEAEKIALEQAKSDGYNTPTLWKELDTKTRLKYQYSKNHNEDILTWKVHIDTSENPNSKYGPALIYYISEENGKIIDFISGIE